MPPHYTNLAWCQLAARDFAGALDSADAALKLKPAYWGALANRAHALLLLGRTEEARQIYKKYVGESVSDSGQLWEDAIPADLDAMEANGLHDPALRLIRDFLKQEAAAKKKTP